MSVLPPVKLLHRLVLSFVPQWYQRFFSSGSSEAVTKVKVVPDLMLCRKWGDRAFCDPR